MALTPKQALFVQEYLVDLNATQAAIRAGYSPKTAKSIGDENLTKPDVAAAVSAAMTKRSARVEITQDYVLSTIQSTVERCRQGEPVRDNEGNPTGEWKFDSQAVLKGCDLLGKHLSMWTEKRVLQGDPDKPLHVDARHVASSELLAQIKATVNAK